MEEDRHHRNPVIAPVDEPHQHRSDAAVFAAHSDDIPPINGVRDFFREFFIEFKKLWYLAGPAIFTFIAQYALNAITQAFSGHVGTIDLAAFSIENSVIAGLCYGVLLGMGSALETLCGQAYGAGQLDMLGIYLQRSWLILISTALLLTLLYVFAEQILKGIRQTVAISEAAGVLALWMIPQLFAYAMNFPIQTFLQAQSKIMVMAWISAGVVVVHTVLSWWLMLKAGTGLKGGAAVLNASWWLVVLGQLVYIMSGKCGRAWSGFSIKAFKNLWGFVRLSLASAVMLCLEMWYFMALILFAGYLKNAEVSVDAFSICMNILGWTVMMSMGMSAAISVRVSNELGASHPRTAKFSLVVAVITSFLISLLLSLILIIFRKQYPYLFSNNTKVTELVTELTPMLAFTIITNNIQPVLSGVAIGAGWQARVSYINIACYYLFGIPLGLILCYKLKLGVKGIWSGMVSGTILQTCVLLFMVYKTNWNKEASLAEDRIQKWGGHEAQSRSEEY